MDRILSERKRRGFVDAEDFFSRVQPAEPEARALIHCGALDRFQPGGHRPALLWRFAAWRKRKGRKGSEPSLFSDPAPPAMPRLPPEDPVGRLRREFSILGFLCERHPMTLFAQKRKTLNTIPARELPRHLNRRVRLAGWLITGKTVLTKKGDPMQFVTFEDETGIVEATFFPAAYRRFCHILDHGRPFLLSGKVEANWGAATLAVDAVRPF
jgi:DNA polymerase-3 subunit alpha/error-prone DNA polymerase